MFRWTLCNSCFIYSLNTHCSLHSNHTETHTKTSPPVSTHVGAAYKAKFCVWVCVGAACIGISVVSFLAQKGTDTHPTHILSAADLHKLQCVKGLDVAELTNSGCAPRWNCMLLHVVFFLFASLEETTFLSGCFFVSFPPFFLFLLGLDASFPL